MRNWASAAWLEKYALQVGAPLIFVALLIRNAGLYPTVFADEYGYSTLSRLVPLASAYLPDYLYLALYNLTNTCGDGFLSCARIMNAVAFVAASPFIFMTARRVCGRGVAILVTLLALIGPINTYTAYFMPEATYFLAFWVITWAILRLDATSGWRTWVATGAVVGAAALVKPHALFLVPAILAYLVVLEKPRGRCGVRPSIVNGVALGVGVLLLKAGGGYLLAGRAGMTLFGANYSSMAVSALGNPDWMSQLIHLSTESAVGHLLAICLMYAMPVAIAVLAAIRSVRRGGSAGPAGHLAIFTILVLADLIIVVALFSATAVMGGGVYESVTRLHMRYYDFALPLLFIVAGASLPETASPGRARWKALAALPIGLAVIYAIVSQLRPYAPILFDGPEVFGFTSKHVVFIVLGCLSLGTLLLWAVGSRWGARAFVYGFLPVAVLASSLVASGTLRQRLVPAPADRAGMFVRQYLPAAAMAHVLVVGSDPSELYRALFYLDNPGAGLEVIPSGSQFDLSTMPSGRDWVLILGDHPWTGGSADVAPADGFALVRRES